MAEPFIHLSGVRKVYRRGKEEFLAISDASFDVMDGELVSLVGPSGCGKSTLLKILAGLLVVIAVVWAAYRFVIRPWHLTWGATSEEISAVQPGDEYVPNPATAVRTRAITIHATPAQIWPWLVQLGADKGGLYSYTTIEKLINCSQDNADRIHPEWQDLKPGDLVKMCPAEFGPPPFHVVALQPERFLVLGQPPLTEADRASGHAWMSTWTFILDPVDANTTRLIVRSRDAVSASWMSIIELGVFIMERGIQARAGR